MEAESVSSSLDAHIEQQIDAALAAEEEDSEVDLSSSPDWEEMEEKSIAIDTVCQEAALF